MNYGKRVLGALLLGLGVMALLVACAGTPEPGVDRETGELGASRAGIGAAELELSSEQVRLDALDARFAAGQVGPFAKANASGFTTFTLSNGIPVIIKRNDANRVRSLTLVLRGGSLLATPETAGIESIMLKTMARGSRAWPYWLLRGKLDETSSGFLTESAFEHSLYTLVTLDKYFDELLPIWASTVVDPAWSAQDFDQVLSDAKLALKRREQDPWQTTATVMNETFFEGHPYAASPEGTEASLASLNLEATKAYYARTVSANRLFMVAVGNYEVLALKNALETAFGDIPDIRVGVPSGPASFEGRVESGLVTRMFPASKGVGYLRGDFAAPAPVHPEYPAARLATKMLSDLLFNVVRDKYGAVYSPGASIRNFSANYGSLIIFKTTMPDKVKAYIDEAIAELAAGRVMSVAPRADEGTEPRQTIAEALPVYKALYVSETYEKIGSNAAVAAEIARSVLQFGDPRAWLLDVDRIAATSAEEVAAAAKRWLVNADVRWVALGSSDVLDAVDAAEFEGFASR